MKKSETKYYKTIDGLSVEVIVNEEYREETQVRVLFSQEVWMDKKKAKKFFEAISASLSEINDHA
jgi:hypothetical protein